MVNIMKKYSKQINLLALAAVLPFVQGCGAGVGGIGALTSFLFGEGGSIGSFLPLGIAAVTGGGGGAELAALHNPEPATMLLVGGGMATMAYFRSRKNRNSNTKI